MTALPVGDDWKKGNEEDISEITNCYCPSCQGGNALSYVLPTKVPYFREILVVSLSCDDCGFRNSEISFGGEIQPQGQVTKWTVQSSDDLIRRQLIKSDSASLKIPFLEFEIPPGTQRGSISTVEGMLKRAADNLAALQPDRLRMGDVDNFHRCQHVIDQLKRIIGQRDDEDEDKDDDEEEQPLFPFELILDDPAGNSYIENPFAPQPDPNMKTEYYDRTPTQDMALGLQPSQEAVKMGTIDDANPQHKNIVNKAATATTKDAHAIDVDEAVVKKNETEDDRAERLGRQEAITFATPCPHCQKMAQTDMCVTDIPHFKEVILMSLLCEACGFKSNEIKGGGAIPKYGTKITLQVTSTDDLAREVLKSDTSGIEIPQIEMELQEGGLEGVYTTVEGLMSKLHDRLSKANPFGTGDSAVQHHLNNDGKGFSEPSPTHKRYRELLKKLQDMANGRFLPFTLVISDPLSNSFVGPIPKDALALSLQAEQDGNNDCYNNYVDSGITLEEYERSHDQNEMLGLNDIKTENYDPGNASAQYYGTDRPEEEPDRIRRVDIRGPDHPHAVGKAPVQGDVTVMGQGSANFAVPGIVQRGKVKQDGAAAASSSTPTFEKSLHDIIRDFEKNDNDFFSMEEYDGPRDGKVFKDGAQGIGYYKDLPLDKLWQGQQDNGNEKETRQ